MPQLRSYRIVGMLLVAALCSACRPWRTAPVKREMLVGNYLYRSAGGPPIHDPDRLTLKADGKYILLHMPGGHPGRTEEGTWQLVRDPDPEVLLGHAGYPVEIKGKRIRLLIDLDLGHWYEKTG